MVLFDTESEWSSVDEDVGRGEPLAIGGATLDSALKEWDDDEVW